MFVGHRAHRNLLTRHKRFKIGTQTPNPWMTPLLLQEAIHDWV